MEVLISPAAPDGGRHAWGIAAEGSLYGVKVTAAYQFAAEPSSFRLD